ncbi:acyl carrier protein phosphodiesterase [Cyclobacterium xiamenense]|uniref:acyl carrier protein phosphodiesterase n=1 Tax=Cyclobacterium xiamenense TaxID=1297121 RepID=UPI0012B788F6|nr:ACP phosphodiesterase [Cyclobacterium xiamenense]
MNFLAHAYLSFNDPKVLVGNFIGDFVRGNLEEQFAAEIVTGILLHREIDAFTDSHPLVKKTQELLKPNFGRYSLVITDMFFDHFLSRNWNDYDERSIQVFTSWVYEVIEANEAILPQKFLAPFTYMKRENWLAAYGTMEGIQRSFTGLSYRTTFPSNMERAPAFLRAHYAFFEGSFKQFFEELIVFSKDKLNQLRQEDDSL